MEPADPESRETNDFVELVEMYVNDLEECTLVEMYEVDVEVPSHLQ